MLRGKEHFRERFRTRFLEAALFYYTKAPDGLANKGDMCSLTHGFTVCLGTSVLLYRVNSGRINRNLMPCNYQSKRNLMPCNYCKY